MLWIKLLFWEIKDWLLSLNLDSSFSIIESIPVAVLTDLLTVQPSDPYRGQKYED